VEKGKKKEICNNVIIGLKQTKFYRTKREEKPALELSFSKNDYMHHSMELREKQARQEENYTKSCLQLLLSLKKRNIMNFPPSNPREFAINFIASLETNFKAPLRKLRDHELVQQFFSSFPVPKLIGKNIENFPLYLSLSVYNFPNQDAVHLLVHIFYVYLFSANELKRHYSEKYEFRDPNMGKMRMRNYLLLSVHTSQMLQAKLNNLEAHIDEITMVGTLGEGTITYTIRNAGTIPVVNEDVQMQFFISHKITGSLIVESTIQYGNIHPFFVTAGKDYFNNKIITVQ